MQLEQNPVTMYIAVFHRDTCFILVDASYNSLANCRIWPLSIYLGCGL